MSKVPAEWTKQEAVWMTWPAMDTWWGDCKNEVINSFGNLACKLSEYILTRINCREDAIDEAKNRIFLNGGDLRNIEFYPFETNDVWCRDSGGIFKLGDEGLEVVDFKYNAWGGKFPPFDKDDRLASNMAKATSSKNIRVENFICEGGALEFSDDGLLLTTDCVILNPNRNPKIGSFEAENILNSVLGTKKVLRLRDGLFNDDTDGHIDNIARFTPCGKILAAYCNKENPSFNQLKENYETLCSFRNLEDKSFEIIKLPVPDEYVMMKKKILPASYANYLVTNGAVLMPSFNQAYSDDRAKDILGEIFTDREIVMIDSRYFLREGGTVHCLTQQQPLWKQKKK